MTHIFTTHMQHATNYTDRCGEVDIVGGFEPDALIYADCCGEKRPASDCVVQCYYDGMAVWCAPEKGCKDPQVIAEKRAREFVNRSAAQKKRWATNQNS